MSDGETYYKFQATQEGLSPDQAAEKQWLGTDSSELIGQVIRDSGNKAVVLCWNEMILLQIQGDKIKKLWFETDLLSMMQQLGAAPKLS